LALGARVRVHPMHALTRVIERLAFDVKTASRPRSSNVFGGQLRN
jgi:hypothetical protein